MELKAFQCSRCCNLYDMGENRGCSAHIDPIIDVMETVNFVRRILSP